MKTEQVNLRLEADLVSALELAAAEEAVDRGTMIRKLLLGALDRRRVDRALQRYQSGEISIGRAAEDARLTHWEMLDLARERGIAYQLDVDDVAERLGLPIRRGSPRVAEGVGSYGVSSGERSRDSYRVVRRKDRGARTDYAETLPDRPPVPGGVLLVGLNPAPRSATAGHYYQGRLGKRLWQRLRRVGLVRSPVPGSEDDDFVALGHGLTDIVKRPTRDARELRRDELLAGVQALQEKVRAWQPGMIVFVFKRAADLALGSRAAPGPGASFEGVPTFLLSGPYAASDQTDRVEAELRSALSMVVPDVRQDAVSQRVTDADLRTGRIRVPQAAKSLLPKEPSEVSIVLRGTALAAMYDPMAGSDRVRSGVLRIGKRLARLVRTGERLRVSQGHNGRLHLD